MESKKRRPFYTVPRVHTRNGSEGPKVEHDDLPTADFFSLAVTVPYLTVPCLNHQNDEKFITLMTRCLTGLTTKTRPD